MPRHNPVGTPLTLPHVPHAGAIEDVLAAASQIEKLEILDLEGQAFSGTLPKQYSFPNLLGLNLINNNIGVRHYLSSSMQAPCSKGKRASRSASCVLALCSTIHALSAEPCSLAQCRAPYSCCFIAACLAAQANSCLGVVAHLEKLFPITWGRASLSLAVAGNPSTRVGPEWHVPTACKPVCVLQPPAQRDAACRLGVGQQQLPVPAGL